MGGVPRPVLPGRRSHQQLGRQRLFIRAGAGPSAQAMRRRSHARQRDETGGESQERGVRNAAAGDHCQYRSGGLCAAQADADAAFYRRALGAVRSGDHGSARRQLSATAHAGADPIAMRGPAAHRHFNAATKKARMAVPGTAIPSDWKLVPRESAQTASLRSLDARNATFLLALILIGSPVAGLRPMRAARWRTCKMPSPTRRRRLPFFRCLTMLSTMSLSIVSACFFAISWLSASSAARCLRVTVGWGFPDFLAAIVDRLLFERLAKRGERLASDAADRGQDPYEIRARHATVIHGYAVLTTKCGRGQYASGVARNRRGRPDPRERA